MLNEITASVYRTLREKAGLGKKDLAPLLHTSRYTVTKFENGRSQPSAAQMRKLMELAGSAEEDVAQMVFKRLGAKVGRPAGFLPRAAADAGPTLLEQGEKLINDYAHRLSARLLEALRSKIKTLQLMGLATDGNKAEMRKLVARALKELERDKV